MGSVERGLLRQGLRYALMLRLIVVFLSSAVSLLLVPAPNRPVTVAVVAGLNVWNAGFTAAMLRLGDRTRRLLPLADIAVVCAVCLAQASTVRSDPRGGATWVLIAVEITVVTYPWLIGRPLLAGATLALTTAYYVGTTWADPGGWLANRTIGVWTAVEAVLSWALYRFVRRAARSADRVVERGEQLRRAAAVAAARRADEREYLAALHDTASATLLMVGSGVAARREDWLAEQAGRDLREISRSDVAAPGAADLIALLREAAAPTPLTLTWDVPAALSLPAVDAVSLTRGAREALTNVVRHARTDHAEIRVRVDDAAVTVSIVDEGRGFNPGQTAGDRYGVTRSLRERMARTGGRALIESSPGHGTTVTMTCPRSVPELTGDDEQVIAASFQRGLRRSVVVLSLAILLLLDLPRVLANRDAYAPLWPQFVTWAGLVAVTVAMVRDRPRRRWPFLLLVLALSALATASVRPGFRLGPAHWSEGDAGWPLVLIMMDSRVAAFAAVLAVQYLLTFGQAALGGVAALSVAGVVNATWVVLAYQLAIAMIAAVLRGLSATSARAVRADERLRTTEEVARHLHHDRGQRYSGLATTAVPLLRGLASGHLDPGAAAVRRSCAAEAARMRRLFADDTAVPDPLAHELRACVELAESNGVTVSFAECGTRPELPDRVRRRLTEPAIAVLATARGKVRLTVAGTRQAVTVSVIAECPPPPVMPDGDGVSRSMMLDGDRLWIQADWRGGS